MLTVSLFGILGHCTMALSCCNCGLIMQELLSLYMQKKEICVLQGVIKVLYTISLTTHNNTPFTALYLRTFSLHLITISHPTPPPLNISSLCSRIKMCNITATEHTCGCIKTRSLLCEKRTMYGSMPCTVLDCPEYLENCVVRLGRCDGCARSWRRLRALVR